MAEPITLAEAKVAARIDADDVSRDALITSLIAAARQLAEQATGRDLVQKDRVFEYADWPSDTDRILVHQATAVAIEYWTGSAFSGLAESAYAWGAVGSWTAIAPALGTSWPALADRAIGPRVRVTVTAGPSDPSMADDCVKTYIKAVVSIWLDNPTADTRSTPSNLLDRLLDPARIWG